MAYILKDKFHPGDRRASLGASTQTERPPW
jgi:hypothetical protein